MAFTRKGIQKRFTRFHSGRVVVGRGGFVGESIRDKRDRLRNERVAALGARGFDLTSRGDLTTIAKRLGIPFSITRTTNRELRDRIDRKLRVTQDTTAPKSKKITVSVQASPIEQKKRERELRQRVLRLQEKIEDTRQTVKKGRPSPIKTETLRQEVRNIGKNLMGRPVKTKVEKDRALRNQRQLTRLEKEVRDIKRLEARAAKRSQRAADIFRATPGLKGDNFFQEAGRELLALPTNIVFGTFEQTRIAGFKAAATARALSIPQTSKAARAEAKRAAKGTPLAIVSSFDPRTPRGLANIAGIFIGARLLRGAPTAKNIKTSLGSAARAAGRTSKAGARALRKAAGNSKVVNKLLTKAKTAFKRKPRGKRLPKTIPTRLRVKPRKALPKSKQPETLRFPTKRLKTKTSKPRKAQRKVFTKQAKIEIRAERIKRRAAKQRLKRERAKHRKEMQPKPKGKARTPKATRTGRVFFGEITLKKLADGFQRVQKNTRGSRTLRKVNVYTRLQGNRAIYYLSRKAYLKSIKVSAKTTTTTADISNVFKRFDAVDKYVKETYLSQQKLREIAIGRVRLKQSISDPSSRTKGKTAKSLPSKINMQGIKKDVSASQQSSKQIQVDAPLDKQSTVLILKNIDKVGKQKTVPGIKKAANAVHKTIKKGVNKAKTVEMELRNGRWQVPSKKVAAKKFIKAQVGLATKLMTALAISTNRAVIIRAKGAIKAGTKPKAKPAVTPAQKQKQQQQQKVQEKAIVIPAQRVDNLPATRQNQIINNIIMQVLGTAAVLTSPGGRRRTIAGGKLNGGIRKIRKWLNNKLKRKRFVFTPDIYSILLGVRVKKGQRVKLLKPGRIFTGLERRPLIK